MTTVISCAQKKLIILLFRKCPKRSKTPVDDVETFDNAEKGTIQSIKVKIAVLFFVQIWAKI